MRFSLSKSLVVMASFSFFARGATAQCFDWDVGLGNPGFTNGVFVPRVQALCSYDDGSPSGAQLVAGGAFVSAGGASASAIARWNGSTWSAFGAIEQGVGPGSAFDLATFDDGGGIALYAIGRFGSAGGVAADNIARYDGASWSPLGFGIGSGGTALAVFDDGTGSALYAGGLFSSAGALDVGGIAKWDGTQWVSIGSGVSTIAENLHFGVYDLAVFDDGSGPALYVAGDFTDISGIAANFIARYDGTSWSTLGLGLNGGVNCLAVHDDGGGAKLYAGGAFTSAGGAPALRVAAWDGSAWSAVGAGVSGGPSVPNVFALQSFDDGGGARLFAGGAFQFAGSQPVNGITAWDGAKWSSLRTGVLGGSSPWVLSLAVHDEGLGAGAQLYAGGSFTSADTHATTSIATWRACTPVGTTFCFGDGSLATPCPCAPPNVVPNPSGAADAGCANSFHLSGGKLRASGTTSPDTVRLLASNLSFSGFGFFIAGSASDASGVAVGDGVRCASGSLVRFGSQNASNGHMIYPNAALGWTAPLSTVTATAPGSGVTEHYQIYYRNAALGFCSSGTANLTNAVAIPW